MRVRVESITLRSDVIPPRSIGLQLQIRKPDNTAAVVPLTGGTPAKFETLGALFRRWGDQLDDGRPLTVKLTANGQRIDM